MPQNWKTDIVCNMYLFVLPLLSLLLISVQADYEANTGCTRVWSRDEPLLVSKTLLLILSGPYISFGQQVLEQLLTLATQDGSEFLAVSLHYTSGFNRVQLQDPCHTGGMTFAFVGMSWSAGSKLYCMQPYPGG